MSTPLTDGQLLDIAGLRLTKPQRERIKRVLHRLDVEYRERPDGSILAFDVKESTLRVDEEPRFD